MVCVLYVDFCSSSTYDNSTYTYCDLELGINDGEVYSDVQNNVVIASEYNSKGDNTNFGLESDNNHPPLSLCEKCGNFDTEGSSNSPCCNQREIASPGPNCTVPQEKVLLERPTARTHKRTETGMLILVLNLVLGGQVLVLVGQVLVLILVFMV